MSDITLIQFQDWLNSRSKDELIATLEKHITYDGWDITNIDEGILTVNFYYDEPDNEEEFA